MAPSTCSALHSGRAADVVDHRDAANMVRLRLSLYDPAQVLAIRAQGGFALPRRYPREIDADLIDEPDAL